jgi:hypothetical protein
MVALAREHFQEIVLRYLFTIAEATESAITKTT